MAADDEPYELVVAGPAARAIGETLPEPVAVAVIDLITGPLLTDPRRVGKPLRRELEGIWSARRGTFRVLYRIDEPRHEIVVLLVNQRRDALRARRALAGRCARPPVRPHLPRRGQRAGGRRLPLPPYREILGAEMSEKVRVNSLAPSLVAGYKLESYDLGTLFDEIEAAGALPDIPVVVVRRGGAKLSDDPLPEGAPFTEAEVDAINAAQWEGQAVWAASVPGAEVITVPGTTHYVQNQRPDAVVTAIREAITRT